MGRLNDSSVFDTRGQLAIGDTRTITATDPKSGEVVKQYTLVRTSRPYIYDLCDAYNASGKGGWYVDHAGGLKIGDPA